MGILDKIKNYRQEASQYLFDSATNKNDPSTYKDPMIMSEITNRDELIHLDNMANGNALAYYIVYKLSENALDDWFKFVDKDGNEIMQEAQRQLLQLDAKRIFTQVLAAERRFGYSYLSTSKNKYIPEVEVEGGKVAKLYFFTPLDCIVFEYDEVGEPKTMEITINVGQKQYTTYEQKQQISAEDFQFWNTRPIGRGYKGRSVLYPIFNELVNIMYLEDSMTVHGIKMAGGIYSVFTKVGIPDEMKTKMDSSFQDISNRRSMIFDGQLIEDTKFVGPPSTATDFNTQIDVCINLIAAGTGIPKDILIGATAGAITGSETNVKALFAALNQIQTSIEPYIRDLTKRMGFTEDYDIDWNVRYAHNEEERAKIDMAKAQTIATKTWLTDNEKRALDGYPPIEGGDELSSDFSIGVSGMDQTPDEQEQDRNEEGENL